MPANAWLRTCAVTVGSGGDWPVATRLSRPGCRDAAVATRLSRRGCRNRPVATGLPQPGCRDAAGRKMTCPHGHARPRRIDRHIRRNHDTRRPPARLLATPAATSGEEMTPPLPWRHRCMLRRQGGSATCWCPESEVRCAPNVPRRRRGKARRRGTAPLRGGEATRPQRMPRPSNADELPSQDTTTRIADGPGGCRGWASWKSARVPGPIP